MAPTQFRIQTTTIAADKIGFNEWAGFSRGFGWLLRLLCRNECWGRQGQMNCKHAAGPRSAIHHDLAAMGLHDVLYDGQTKPRAAEFTAAGTIDAVKTFKQPRQMFGRDAATLVAHGNADFSSVGLH